MASQSEDLPERFVCPTFLSSAVPANDMREAAPSMRGMRKQRVANVHPTADVPPIPRRPGKQGKQGKKRSRRPGILDLAMVIFAVAIYLTWAHASGTDWLTPTLKFVNGLIPA